MQFQNFPPYSQIASAAPPAPPKKPSHLLFTPPGFTHHVFVPFPGRVLPVCARCKKNYKTREHCRNKEAHSGMPWVDTFMCIALDDTCVTADGKLKAGEFVCNPSTNNAFQYEIGKELLPKTPSCAQCKDKNYTRTYCRINKKHRTLPWSTVYVTLTHSATSMARQEEAANEDGEQGAAKKRKANDGNAVVEGEGQGQAAEEKSPNAKSEEETAEESSKKTVSEEEEKATDEKKEETIEDGFWSKIPSSRAFLSTVSVDKNEVEWVDVDKNVIISNSNTMQQQNGGQMVPTMDGAYGYGYSVISPQGGMHPMYPYYAYPQGGASPTKEGEEQQGQWVGGYPQGDANQMYAHPMMGYPPYGYAMQGYGYPPPAEGQGAIEEGQQHGNMGYFYGMQQMHDMNGQPAMSYDPQMYPGGMHPQSAYPPRQESNPPGAPKDESFAAKPNNEKGMKEEEKEEQTV